MSDPLSTYVAKDVFTIINNDSGPGPGLINGLDARDTGIAAYATQIRAAGYSFVGQYIGRDSTYLTPAQAAQLEAAGLRVFSIYEKGGMADTDSNGNHTYAWQTYFSESQGEADASTAYTAATQFAHQPFGSAIYFAIDVDPGNTSGITSRSPESPTPLPPTLRLAFITTMTSTAMEFTKSPAHAAPA